MTDAPPTKPELPSDWEPRAHERRYLRNTTTGDLGWFVRRGGRDCVRLDRPNEEIVRTYHANEWSWEDEERPVSEHQIAKMCFEADKALCAILGLTAEARASWLDLNDEGRLFWMKEGPSEPKKRRQLWKLLRAFMKVAS